MPQKGVPYHDTLLNVDDEFNEKLEVYTDSDVISDTVYHSTTSSLDFGNKNLSHGTVPNNTQLGFEPFQKFRPYSLIGDTEGYQIGLSGCNDLQYSYFHSDLSMAMSGDSEPAPGDSNNRVLPPRPRSPKNGSKISYGSPRAPRTPMIPMTPKSPMPLTPRTPMTPRTPRTPRTPGVSRLSRSPRSPMYPNSLGTGTEERFDRFNSSERSFPNEPRLSTIIDEGSDEFKDVEPEKDGSALYSNQSLIVLNEKFSQLRRTKDLICQPPLKPGFPVVPSMPWTEESPRYAQYNNDPWGRKPAPFWFCLMLLLLGLCFPPIWLLIATGYFDIMCGYVSKPFKILALIFSVLMFAAIVALVIAFSVLKQ